MRGRKPKPNALKRLEGNPGKRPINGREPKPSDKTPRPPANVKGEALDEWKRIAPELEAMGLLAIVDRAALAAYCITYARWMDAEAQIEKDGTTIVTTHGNQIQHPVLGVANTAMKLCYKFAVEFGFTPASRSRLAIKPPGDEGDSLPGYSIPTPRAPE